MIKKIFYLIIATLLSASSIKAQTTEGTEFWVTFGSIMGMPMLTQTVSDFDFTIRIIGGNVPTSGTIEFTNLGTFVPFGPIEPYEIYNYSLDDTEKPAVFNEITGTTNNSIRITASNSVSVYALRNYRQRIDVTNLLPVTALGTEYFAISYQTYVDRDAYAVVATQNGTEVSHNGDPVATLDAREVYYRGYFPDMTGDYISANKPVAFFAQSAGTSIPEAHIDILFQQLAPVHTWGKTFFVPVTEDGINYVRIVVAKENTTITQTGGTIRTQWGGKEDLTNLQRGDFVELEILLSNNGCFIDADQPVGVCSFMRSGSVINPTGSCAQVWIPSIEQTTSKVLTAPFVHPYLTHHDVSIITPTATKENTMVSIGGADPIPLSESEDEVVWYDDTAEGSDMSFCNFPLTDFSASYLFSNPAKMIVLGYGMGSVHLYNSYSSYYYLAGSAMRDLDVAFYANDVHFQELEANPFYENEVAFRAEIEGELHPEPEERLKWFIDGEEEVSVRGESEWDEIFPVGEYEITMLVRFENGDEISKTGILKISPFCGGDGTAVNPYLICNAAQLDAVRLFLDAHFKLADDIPLNDYLSSGAGHTKWGDEGWEPIGTAFAPFTGSLNGDGYKITGLWINRNSNRIGLFGVIDGATIENLEVVLNQ